MTWSRRALRDNGATATASMAAISSILLLLGRAVSAMLSLETKLMAVSLAWICVYPLQRILVRTRRRQGHRWLVDKATMAAYFLPPILAFYAANAVYFTSYSHTDESTTPVLKAFALWMLCSTLCLSSSRIGSRITNMTAYSLRDGPRDRWSFVQWVVFLGFVQWEWSRTWSPDQGLMKLLDNMTPHVILPFFILFANPPKSTLDYETKAVADYMKRESIMSSSSSSPFFDDDATPNGNSSLQQQLDCCRYPFMQQKDGKWTTIKDLLHKCPDLLPSSRDKDICLSYSLSRLLARRYYGFHCAEEGDVKVRRFALAQLATDGGYKRAFAIVEVQLAFLHDYFFTASLPLTKLSSGALAPGEDQKHEPEPLIFLAMGIFFLLMATIRNPALHRYQDVIRQAPATIVLAIILHHILLPVHTLLPTYWHLIQISFPRLINPSLPAPTTANFFQNIVSKYVFPPPTPSPNNGQDDVLQTSETQTGGSVYWRDKMGQYSILHDYDRRRSRTKTLIAWFQGHVLSQLSHSFIKHLPVEEDDVKVLDNVRELVANTLRDIDGPPTNGTRSLKINKESTKYDWSWTCREETHADTILIWHIATCYCDMSHCHCDPTEEFPLETDTSYEVATTLSRYCAYLVAFLPEFLSEHSLTSKETFQRVLQEARHALGRTLMEEKEKLNKIQGLQLPLRRNQTTFHKGVKLGRQLEKLDTRLRWNVMAEFWAETILYVAPSDNAEAQIEHLAKGGELITHLWAMLSNAGILKRATGEWHPPSGTARE